MVRGEGSNHECKSDSRFTGSMGCNRFIDRIQCGGYICPPVQISDKPMTLPTLKIKYLIGPRIVLGPFFNYEFRLSEALCSFSIFLESIATLPQSLSL